jgi:RNA polymerase sigma-70 factor (ECF subfamily)
MGTRSTIQRDEGAMFLLLLLALPDLPAEDQLLARAREGDRKAIANIYEAFFEPVYQFIRWRVDDPALAEDLTSDVFIKFLSALRSPYAPRHSLRGWLFQVARNVLRDHYRQPVMTTPFEEGPNEPAVADFEAQLLAALDAERVRGVFRMLAPDQQEVLILRFGQMQNLEATAESMGKSVQAVKSLQFRAISTLRQMLGAVPQEADHG